MTFAGKKLQDIYDSGAANLAELEGQVTQRLKQSKQEHTETFKKHLEGGVTDVQKNATQLQADLTRNVDKSLDQLRDIAEDEIKECRAHAFQMISELSNLSDKLRLSIAALKEAYGENVEHIGVSFSDRYLTSVEHSKLELEKQEFESSRHLKNHGTTVSFTLQQRLDKVLWESRGDEKHVSGSLFKIYMQKANAIDSHFSSLLQKLSTDFNSSYRSLENETNRAESELGASSKVLLDKVDEHASKIEHRVSEHFQNISDAHRQKLDGDLANVAEDLSNLHDATTEKLGQSTEELVGGLVGSAEEAQEALRKRCQDVKATIARDIQSLSNRLSDRVTTGTSLKRTLEADKDSVLDSIRSEIHQIRDAFETKVMALIQEAGGRVTHIVTEAESDILGAQKGLEQSLADNALTSKEEIENEVSKFLELIAQHRSAALDDIAKAAENSGPGSDKSSKRSRKTKDQPEINT
jgi:hypothetical protein